MTGPSVHLRLGACETIRCKILYSRFHKWNALLPQDLRLSGIWNLESAIWNRFIHSLCTSRAQRAVALSLRANGSPRRGCWPRVGAGSNRRSSRHPGLRPKPFGVGAGSSRRSSRHPGLRPEPFCVGAGSSRRSSRHPGLRPEPSCVGAGSSRRSSRHPGLRPEPFCVGAGSSRRSSRHPGLRPGRQRELAPTRAFGPVLRHRATVRRLLPPAIFSAS